MSSTTANAGAFSGTHHLAVVGDVEADLHGRVEFVENVLGAIGECVGFVFSQVGAQAHFSR